MLRNHRTSEKEGDLAQIERLVHRGAWVARSVKRPTLGFGSGHDVTVHEFGPRIRPCAGSMEPAWDCLSPTLSASPPARAVSVSLKQINTLKINK